MLQFRPHMNDSKLTVRYIPPFSTKVPTAESPSTSLRSAFAQMRSYGPACACVYVSGVSNRCAGPAGSSSESQKTASGWARVRAISSSAARSVNVLDTPGGCFLDLDLVTAGVTRYRFCCSGPDEDDRTTRWSPTKFPLQTPCRKWFHRRWAFLLLISTGPSPKSPQPLRRLPPTVPALAAATAAVAVSFPPLPRPRLPLNAAAAAVAAATAFTDAPPPRHRPRLPLSAAAAGAAAAALADTPLPWHRPRLLLSAAAAVAAAATLADNPPPRHRPRLPSTAAAVGKEVRTTRPRHPTLATPPRRGGGGTRR